MALNVGRLRMEARRAIRPLGVIGVLIVCAVAVLIALVSQQTFQRPWDDYSEYRVAFDDVKGVVPGQQEVRVAGVKVGTIKSSGLVGSRAVLTLAIRKSEAPLYRNATFRLRPKTPLQDMYVAVTRGTPKDGELSAKTIVPAAQTVTPVDVSRVLQSFDADTRQRLSVLLNGFGAGLKDRGQDLQAAFVQLAPFMHAADSVTHELAIRQRRVSRLVTSSGGLAQALGQQDRALSTLVRDGNTTLGTLARRDVPLRSTLQELPGTLTTLQRAITQLGGAQDQLDPALSSLQPAAQHLGPALSALDRISGDLKPAAEHLRPAVDALRPLARTLPDTARSLNLAVSQLRPQLPDVDLALRKLSACEDAFQKFFTWTYQVGKFRDGYSAYPRGSISVGLDSAPGASPATNGLTKYPTCTTKAAP